MAETTASLGPATLGDLARAVAGPLLDRPRLHATFTYRERTTTLPPPGRDGDIAITDRTFRAAVEEEGPRLAATLRADRDGDEVVGFTVGCDGGGAWYTGEDGWGPLRTPGRLGIRHYLQRLDVIPVSDSDVQTGRIGGGGPLRITAWLSLEAFALLLTLTGGDPPESAADTGFLSHRVELVRHHGNLELRGSWIMLGDSQGAQTRVRATIDVVCGPSEGDPVLGRPPGEATLPPAEDVDEVWRRLRPRP